MKDSLPVIKMLACLLAMQVCVLTVNAQVIKPQKATDVQVKEMEKTRKLSSYSDKFSSSQKQQAKDKVQMLTTYFYKAILHRSDKVKYPADNNNATEKRMIGMVEALSSKLYEKAKDHVQAGLADKSKKDKDLGKYSDMVFAGKPLAEQFKARGYEVKKAEKIEMPKIKDNLPINFLLNGLYCVDETNPESGDDDMIVGAMFSSAGGNVRSGDAFFCGRFNDGDLAVCNDHTLGAIKYAWKENYPQTYYGMIVLLETDEIPGDEAIAISDLNYILSAAASNAEAMDVDPYLIPVVMEELIELFSDLFFSDDIFKPYCIKVELKAQNDIYINDAKVVFNANGTDVWNTEGINENGGTYKVALRFKR